MNDLSRSSTHSASRNMRSLRRSNTGMSPKSRLSPRVRRANSLGRNAALRMQRQASFRNPIHDAFGTDVFDLDPSADFSSNSFSTSFDDIPHPFESNMGVRERPAAVVPIMESLSPRSRPRILRRTSTESRRDVFAKSKSGSRRSFRGSQRRLTSSLRNITDASLEF